MVRKSMLAGGVRVLTVGLMVGRFPAESRTKDGSAIWKMVNWKFLSIRQWPALRFLKIQGFPGLVS